MVNFTDSEKVRYFIIGTLVDHDFPLVYKGALVTKLILEENNFNEFSREKLDYRCVLGR
jgi:hypothetical protein